MADFYKKIYIINKFCSKFTLFCGSMRDSESFFHVSLCKDVKSDYKAK